MSDLIEIEFEETVEEISLNFDYEAEVIELNFYEPTTIQPVSLVAAQLTGATNNVNRLFLAPSIIKPGTEQVSINGIIQLRELHYEIEANEVTLDEPAEPGDILLIIYAEAV